MMSALSQFGIEIGTGRKQSAKRSLVKRERERERERLADLRWNENWLCVVRWLSRYNLVFVAWLRVALRGERKV